MARGFRIAAPRAAHKEFFIRFLAHEFQVRVNGGLRKSSSKALNEFEQIKSSSAERVAATETKLCAGARLLRQWGGVAHEVMVMERGYAYRGRSYTSLSEIARYITGARWSGPRFFGLRSQSKHAASGADRVSPAKKVRCAIYTRKSSEEGLEQDFNSLHAQRTRAPRTSRASVTKVGSCCRSTMTTEATPVGIWSVPPSSSCSPTFRSVPSI